MSDLDLSFEQTFYLPKYETPAGAPEHAFQEAVRSGDLAAARQEWAALEASQVVTDSSAHPLALAVRDRQDAMVNWLLTLPLVPMALGFAVAHAMEHPVNASWWPTLMAKRAIVGVEQYAQVIAARQGFAKTALALWKERQVGHQQTLENALLGGHDDLAHALLLCPPVPFTPDDTVFRQAIQYRCPRATEQMLTHRLSLKVLKAGLKGALRTHQWDVAERVWNTPVDATPVPLNQHLVVNTLAAFLVDLLKGKNDDGEAIAWVGRHANLSGCANEAVIFAVHTAQVTCAQALIEHIKDFKQLRSRLVKSSQPDWETLDQIGLMLPPEQQEQWVKQTNGAEERMPLMVAGQRQREALARTPVSSARRRLRS